MALGVGAKDENEYLTKAKEFLTSPRGKHGDAFVGEDGVIGRYDYSTNLFAKANSKGTIITFWNLTYDKTPEYANKYWEEEKSKYEN